MNIVNDLKHTLISFKKMGKRVPFAICMDEMKREDLIIETAQVMSYMSQNIGFRPREIKVMGMQIGSVV